MSKFGYVTTARNFVYSKSVMNAKCLGLSPVKSILTRR